jgi:riboflavin kinase / FMN adenylyltransferase
VTTRTVVGRESLEPSDGPILVAIGVFDGLHRGHAWLLEHLVRESRSRDARPTVITFDAHPDAVLVGAAPPLLMDPQERLERLGALGVEVVVIEHFDDALRRTPYDAFIAGITTRCRLAGIVMTPDSAFGHERAGTPDAVADLGSAAGFDVVVVPPFQLDGREVRSSDIRSAISHGDLERAARLLGRPYAIVGEVVDGAIRPAMPVALPPPGAWPASVGPGGLAATLRVTDEDRLLLEPPLANVASLSAVRVELLAPASG